MIRREELIAFARTMPARHPKVRNMLEVWMEETRIPEGTDEGHVALVEVAIMHSAMKYRLGFISKQEVLEELEQERQALLPVRNETQEVHNRLSQLMYAIEEGRFELVHRP